MNKSGISRELLLGAAREIAYSRGLSQVNIRAVASQCGVAVGSIYNYFPTKADLIAAVIEDFWRTAAHRETCTVQPGECYPHYVGRLYAELFKRLSLFQSGWLAQISVLSAETRQKGRALEAKCFAHLCDGLTHAMAQDPRTAKRPDEWAALTDLTFRTVMSLLREGAPDCTYLQQVLEGYLSHEPRSAPADFGRHE